MTECNRYLQPQIRGRLTPAKLFQFRDSNQIAVRGARGEFAALMRAAFKRSAVNCETGYGTSAEYIGSSLVCAASSDCGHIRSHDPRKIIFISLDI